MPIVINKLNISNKRFGKLKKKLRLFNLGKIISLILINKETNNFQKLQNTIDIKTNNNIKKSYTIMKKLYN